jgi:hypothetical protein
VRRSRGGSRPPSTRTTARAGDGLTEVPDWPGAVSARTLEEGIVAIALSPQAIVQTREVNQMRVAALAFVSVLLGASCSSGAGTVSQGASPGRATLRAIRAHPGPDVPLVPGTSDFSPGRIRLSFLVIRRDGAAVSRPAARVWVAKSLDAKPFAKTAAALEPIGVPSGSFGYDPNITRLYVARFSVPRAGKYVVLAEPVGGKPIQALGSFLVKRVTASPPIGSKASRSRTPTFASEHGNVAKLTSRVPPDTALLRYSVADSLVAHKPFVLVFATPKFCQSRTCGPVVDVADKVRERFAGTDIRFIHVEIYENNDPSQGPNRWVKEWRLPSEPWTFLVGRDGRIKVKFEGSESVAELSEAVRRYLVRRGSG